MRVQLPAASKASTSETDASVEENSLPKNCSPVKMGDSLLDAHLNISVRAEMFLGRDRGSRTKRQREGVPYMQVSTVHSDEASDSLVCIILV